MAKIDLGKSMKKAGDSLHGAVESVKTAAKDAKLPDIKAPDMREAKEKLQKVRDAFRKKGDMGDESSESHKIETISTHNALKIIYYLMAVDGQIFHSEEEKYDAIGLELDPSFSENKEQIVKECRDQMDKAIDSDDYYGVLQDGVEAALIKTETAENSFITPKLLIWDLLTVAYSDENYDYTERKLLKYIVRKLDVDKTVFLELESSILTLIDLEKELQWIKTTDRPYLKIEAEVNEIADRKNVIFESVKDLIAL